MPSRPISAAVHSSGVSPNGKHALHPRSRLGEKLAYIARHWDGLQLFLADGRVEMDSNSVENLIRPVALNRKNVLSPVTTKARPPGAGSLR